MQIPINSVQTHQWPIPSLQLPQMDLTDQGQSFAQAYLCPQTDNDTISDTPQEYLVSILVEMERPSRRKQWEFPTLNKIGTVNTINDDSLAKTVKQLEIFADQV
jgi:hypothetical protein